MRDLDITFNRLNKVAELAVKGNFGAIRERPKYKLGELYPMLQRCMIRAKCAIDRRLSPRMSKVHPWMVIFDLPMAQEVFNILHKDVLGLTRYGLEVEEKPGSTLLNCCVKWCELHKEKTPVKQGNSKTLSNSSIYSGCYNAST